MLCPGRNRGHFGELILPWSNPGHLQCRAVHTYTALPLTAGVQLKERVVLNVPLPAPETASLPEDANDHTVQGCPHAHTGWETNWDNVISVMLAYRISCTDKPTSSPDVSINLLRSVSVLAAAGQQVSAGKIFCQSNFPRETPVSADENCQRKRSILLALLH